MASYLIVAPQGLGDALEATPMAVALKRAQPGCRIGVAVLRPGPRELFDGLHGLVDDVYYYPYWERGSAAFAASLARSLTKMPRYDVSLLAFPAARAEYRMLARLFGARTRVAHDHRAGSRSIARRSHDLLVPVERKHNVLRNLDLVRALGFDVDPSTTYAVPRSWTGGERHDDRIAIHVGTVTHHGLSNKRWPVDRFAELARRLSARGFEICVIAGPDEREESKRVVEGIPEARRIERALADIARFLSGCAAAVTNDSGIGHLAAAVGTNVVALHGPTPLEGGPYGPTASRFRPSACPPCFEPRLRNTECALGIDFACLRRDMTVDAVEDELLRILSNRRIVPLEGQTAARP